MESPVQEKRNKAFKRSFNAFLTLYNELIEEYPDQHVALCDGKVVDHDPDLELLVDRIRNSDSINLDDCMIEYVSKDTEGVLL